MDACRVVEAVACQRLGHQDDGAEAQGQLAQGVGGTATLQRLGYMWAMACHQYQHDW